MRSVAHLLIASARTFVAEHRPRDVAAVKPPDYQGLADWYQELRTVWNRVYYYCKIGNGDVVFSDVCNLQNELGIIDGELRRFCLTIC